jgi:hypothetical protein
VLEQRHVEAALFGRFMHKEFFFELPEDAAAFGHIAVGQDELLRQGALRRVTHA